MRCVRNAVTASACLAAFFLGAGAVGQTERSHPVDGDITAEGQQDPVALAVAALLDTVGIPGASVALIRNGRMLWVRGFGVVESGDTQRVDAHTVFEGASLTKPIVAAGVLRMVQRGEFDLDRPLHEILPYPDIASDSRYTRITARMVLSHTTGFPNWRRDQPLSIRFDPGTQHGYSGEGFVYLQNVIEHITRLPLGEWAKREVLDVAGMARSHLVWEDRFASNMARPHDTTGEPLPKARPHQANAAASLHTTAEDYARFLLALHDGTLLDGATWQDMRTPQVVLSERIAWGLGVALQDPETDSAAIWHWGDNRGYKDFAIFFPSDGDGLVYLSNSDSGMSIVHAVLAAAFGSEQPAERHIRYPRHDAPGHTGRTNHRQPG